MQQRMQYKFYDLGAKLYGLFNVRTHGRIADLFGPLTDAQKSLDALIKGDPIELKVAKIEANKLLTQISALFDKYFIDQTSRQLRFPTGEAKVDAQELALIHLALEKFESALSAELSRIVVYPAAQLGIYSAVDLVENAHQAIPPESLAYVPGNARRELDLAGRALGFELGTAATMHMLRALEIVTGAYYELFAGPLPGRGERNLSTYLRKLTALAGDDDIKTKPDPRMIQTLTQIKESYRNPLTQSESNITTGMAAMLFGLVISVITQLTEQIAARSDHSKTPTGTGLPVSESQNAETGSAQDVEEPGEAVEDSGEDEEDIYDFRVSQTA